MPGNPQQELRFDAPQPARPETPIIYVDSPIHFWRGRYWCHLFSEDIAALHAFAARLGLKRSWFQQPPKASWSHYDISSGRRDQAVRLGAVPADRYMALEVSLRLEGKLTAAWQDKIAACRRQAARPIA